MITTLTAAQSEALRLAEHALPGAATRLALPPSSGPGGLPATGGASAGQAEKASCWGRNKRRHQTSKSRTGTGRALGAGGRGARGGSPGAEARKAAGTRASILINDT